MDSVPQEIIDEIIDNLPRFSLRSSALVAKRWRKRSQQRALDNIRFGSESVVKRYTQSDPGETSSYVQLAQFFNITEWENPALFSHVLEAFNSLTTLVLSNTEIPDGMVERVSRGGLGNRVTTLYFRSIQSSLAVPMILAFQNLQILIVQNFTVTSREPPLARPVSLRRRPLDSLRVVNCTSDAIEALVNLHLAPRRLVFDVKTANVQKLLVHSSVTVVQLVLLGMCSLCVDHKCINDDFVVLLRPAASSQLIDLPPFPALTSMKISGRAPVPNLISILSSISSAPVLASIELQCWWKFPLEPDSLNAWDCLDKWLTQMANNTTAEGGLVLTLKRMHRNQVPEFFLPGFRRVGKINTDPSEINTSESALFG